MLRDTAPTSLRSRSSLPDQGAILTNSHARRLLKKAWPPIGGCWGIWDGFVIQGFERADPELPDAAALAGHLGPAGSMFAFLAVHRAEGFRDAAYAELFAPGAGRPSPPATRSAPWSTVR